MIADFLRKLRNLAGVLLKDWWRYERALLAADESYLAICNREERLEAAPSGTGYRCQWQWSSELHAPKFVSRLGHRLMRRALTEHPTRRATTVNPFTGSPDITFIIGHRGMDRLPHLLATLESIAGQEAASVECLVVEQDIQARIADLLPSWVRHIHTPLPVPDMPYCRSWAFNCGAKYARGAVLVLHDNDMLVPSDYSTNILKQVRNGAEVVNLKRFIFYLSEAHTRRIFSGSAGLLDETPVSIVQNLEAGGSIAITRVAYKLIGGMDESFIGWGGEDNEFWERAITLKVWPYACLPIVHLWHAAQPGKYQADNGTLKHYQTLSRIPASVRIAQLRSRAAGAMSGPSHVPLEN